jgi:hypothetical protein
MTSGLAFVIVTMVPTLGFSIPFRIRIEEWGCLQYGAGGQKSGEK